MRVLFIHQNFPGQFPHLSRVLAADPGNEVVAVGEAKHLKDRGTPHKAVKRVGYEMPKLDLRRCHPFLRNYETQVVRGQVVHRLLDSLARSGFAPDLVIAHPGWGEALFLRDVFPKARIILYGEFFYRAEGADVGFDPEMPSSPEDALRLRVWNSAQMVSLDGADQMVCPTRWQGMTYPRELQSKIRVQHDGIDTQRVAPDPAAVFEHKELRLTRADEVVTYVARNLEPYRGFHTLMRALPRLQALRPQAQVVIVGGEGVSYGDGRRGNKDKTYREIYSAEVDGRVDWSRVHFTGRLPYGSYLRLLQVSSAHVYLTYPFVLSWSMLESMAAGCVVVGSNTAPVREVIIDGQNGLLADFFDAPALAERVAEVLADPPGCEPLRAAARQTVVERYDLHTRCLPDWLNLIGYRPPTGAAAKVAPPAAAAAAGARTARG